MSGLPLLPGFTIDKTTTRTKYNIPRWFVWEDGRPVSKRHETGISDEPLEANSILYTKSFDLLKYDPSLTYGRTKQYVPPVRKPNFVLYDKKCLAFKGYFRQEIADSPVETYRIRKVNVTYFLEDDTITVLEPPVVDAGFPQGKLVTRGKITNENSGQPWHWTDFNVGENIRLYANTYHLSSCDTYTREYLISQGVEVNPDESIPDDPYIETRKQKNAIAPKISNFEHDLKLKKWLEYNGMVLRFSALWDKRETEQGDLELYGINYYLEDDTIEIVNVKEPNSGKDPLGLLLRRMRIPKKWNGITGKFPSCYLEITDAEVEEYYRPHEFIIGSTVFLLGRRFLITDCDEFTRKYFAHVYNVEQGKAVNVEKPKKEIPKQPIPPYIPGFGTVEDSLQSWFHFDPSPPKTDLVRYLHNMSKKLRYTAVMDYVHPEDKERQFIFEYRLSDGALLINELRIRNSGFKGGLFLKPILLPKPNTDPNNPEYYTPLDFDIGAIVNVYGHRFRITGADLAVFRYMEANREKFPGKMLMSLRSHLVREGVLDEDIRDIAEYRQREDATEPVPTPAPETAS